MFDGAAGLLRKMESLGMVFDVTHTSDESVRQALDIFTGPVLASHQNCRAIVPGDRQFNDEMLTRHVEKDWGGNKHDRHEFYPPDEVTLQDLAGHIEHVRNLAGNAFHAATGGDTDGQGGAEGAPFDVDTVADYQKVADVLTESAAGTTTTSRTLCTAIGIVSSR